MPPIIPHLSLILGGAASGKSLYAERKILALQKKAYYIATAREDTLDTELNAKIKKHQQRRNNDIWTTITADDIPHAMQTLCEQDYPILIDGIDLWCANAMEHQHDMEQATLSLLYALHHHKSEMIVLVSTEVGMGTIASHPQTRQYRDQLGLIHQKLAAAADEVTLIVAGLPTLLKSP